MSWEDKTSQPPALAAMAPIVSFAEGGLFHFRNHHQHDYTLRLWTAVVLAAGGDTVRAAAEFEACGAPASLAQAYREAALSLKGPP